MMSPSRVSQIVPCSSVPQVLVVAAYPPLGKMLAWTLTLSGCSVMSIAPEVALIYTREAALLPPALFILDTYTRRDRVRTHEQLQHLARWCVQKNVPLLLLVDGPSNRSRLQEHIAVLGKPFHLQNLRQLVWQLVESKAGSHHHLLPTSTPYHGGTSTCFTSGGPKKTSRWADRL